jgi:protein-tyrosine phosphatase
MPGLPEPRDPSGRYAVTFVCTGNICRSPMGDVILRRMLGERGLRERVIVTSSGTGDWHVGQGADPRTVTALEQHGYDGEAHRAAQFDASIFASYDLIVAMDRGHRSALRRLAPDPEAASRVLMMRDFDPDGAAVPELVEGPDVPDPYYGNAADFESVLAMIERSCRVLADELERTLTPGR